VRTVRRVYGSGGRNRGAELEEGPAHTVTVEPFYIDRTPVRNDDYVRFDKSHQAGAPGALPAYRKMSAKIFFERYGNTRFVPWGLAPDDTWTAKGYLGATVALLFLA
jgi:formylglycine-generating enzyme required for sulfatase activity